MIRVIKPEPVDPDFPVAQVVASNNGNKLKVMVTVSISKQHGRATFEGKVVERGSTYWPIGYFCKTWYKPTFYKFTPE